ncbi:VCBS repeat-containing protein [Maribacter halichondriae]|uniref:VCBS repeat-containing protein n=1 Tax=Maribacter halichondriae TaxID=2980554 RepID=UPI0023591AF8|nr:VCBS repeat-containing protein [Maribacter sp. Hal144]
MTSLLFVFSTCGDKKPISLFTKVDSETSGLDFNNRLVEDDSINILDNEFVYNGAGVALGDVNGDGLDDIFFAGNQVGNKMFLNKGGLRFDDISTEANIVKPDSLMWSSGVSIVDINTDGKLDLYVCNTFRNQPHLRKNLLYINKGNDENNIPVFKEMAEVYGIADSTYSSHAQFFDYDMDGDLDLFIGVNRIEGINPNEFSPLTDDGSSKSRDKLYENTWNDSLQQQKFVNVSDSAGIRYHGYSHSTLINDFNEDGWMDIYVANDFLSNDLLYINNQDGTFTNRAGDIFKHFSLSSMGSDLADVDNNGQLDLFTSEMQPYYNKRKKLFQGPSSYQKEIFTRKYRYEQQYTRNTLQHNLGINPETQLPIFGEIGMFAGIKETDWSWAPLFADYDNDGWQDLLITNGFPKDVTDRDFGDFRITASRLVSKEQLIAAIPEIKIPNFIYRNKGGLEFEDVTTTWGLNFGTYSNGAVYGDLDNDGDLDLVINNINDPATLLENHADRLKPKSHFLRLKLRGTDENPAAIGAKVTLHSQESALQKTLLAGRGYLSQPELYLHFGLGEKHKADSITITWPDGKVQGLVEPTIDTVLTIVYGASTFKTKEAGRSQEKPLFKEVSKLYDLNFFAGDHDFIDFNFQTTLPHKFSKFGPSLSVGDVSGDGLDDLFVAGSRGFEDTWFLQNGTGDFIKNPVNYKKGEKLEEEDSGTLLFDADNDDDLDLYIARGCGQYPANHEYYRDILMINDGKGNFSENTTALPNLTANSSAVKAADYDHDGDLDLFVGSRVLPFSYPSADRSFILRNESTAKEIKFIDATKEVSSELLFPGMVSDALWTDFNGDSWPDLILACEWMPLRFFKNDKGALVEVTQETGIQNKHGWWNSLAAADIDNDGDIDYIAGNLGGNTYFKGTQEEPVRLYAKDLDQNGTIDPLISYYLRDSVGVKKEYLYHPWQDVTKQYVGIRKKFNSFGAFGESTLPEMFSDGLLDDAQKFTLNETRTSWVENLGNGKFELHPLPLEVQMAPIFGILPTYLNDDSAIDLLLIGNDFGMEVQQGPADALIGISLKNDGKGNFKTLPIEESHFFVPGDGKSLVHLNIGDDKMLTIASQNNDSLRVFEFTRDKPFKSITLRPNEVKTLITFTDGSKSVRETQWGSTFNSQSSRTFNIPLQATEIKFYDVTGRETRSVSF